MATIPNILSAIFFFTVISKGYCQCKLDQISVSQSQTGKLVQNKPEWNVVISNGCVCTLLNLKLSCNGFQTVENVDSSILAKSGDECLVSNGNPIYRSSTVNFSYAWDTSFPFKPISFQISCS